MTTKNSLPVNKWTWRAVGTPPPVKKPMSMRTKATIQAPIMILVGWLLFHFFHHLIAPVIIWSLAGLVFIGGWFIPSIFMGFEKFGMWMAKWVGLILNWGLLVPFFYLCFVPGRLILKLKGIDPMDREFPSSRSTFWIPRKPIADIAQYRKQH